LSESAAYARITAARASRAFPGILTHLADGRVTLTSVSLLAAHLTDENHEALLRAASHKSRRDVERLVASLVAQPDVASSVRRLPDRRVSADEPVHSSQRALSTTPQVAGLAAPPQPVPLLAASSRRPTVVAPIGSDRFLLRVTLSAQAHEKLVRARALLRHQIPSGDPAPIVERALTALVEQLERKKHASTPKPRTKTSTSTDASTSRHVPSTVKRAVWTRDGGRCAFVGADGRCGEVGFLEFHHVVPFAAGGVTDAENLQLRCRAHNAYEATLFEQSSRTMYGRQPIP
jgi:5-methylcytosine-specific restriction endonuclease McrA